MEDIIFNISQYLKLNYVVSLQVGMNIGFQNFGLSCFLYAKIKIGIKLCKNLYIFYSKLILLENGEEYHD